MNENAPQLSICIPTFNRLQYLKESLDVLLPQAQEYGVEVCVSDNCSSDGTVDYLAQQAEYFTCLRYYVQNENKGLERNMIMSISMGSGRYILPIGDDEVLPEGSVHSIIEELIEDVDLLILNGWHTDASLSKKLKPHLSLSLQGKSFSSPSAAFKQLWSKMPLGSFLARREFFQEKYVEYYIGTSHAYTGLVWEALAKKQQEIGRCRIKCMTEPTVLFRGGDKSWRNDAARIMLYEIPKWFSLLMKNDEYKNAAGTIREDYIRRQLSLISLLRFHAMNQIESLDIQALSEELSKSQLITIINIKIIPVFVAGFLINFYDVIAGIIKRVLKK